MGENNTENIETKIIKTQDENGEFYSFELIDVIEFEGREYGLLVPVKEDGEENSCDDSCSCGCKEENASPEACDCGCEEEDEVVIMRLNKEDDSYVFETIEDDEEFNRLIEYIEAEEDDEEE